MNRAAKLSLISYILSRLGDKREYYGKIVIQKIIYYLQEAENVNLGYRFKFYHYGPYSEELNRDLQVMELNGIIESKVDPRGMGYSITVNKNKFEEFAGTKKLGASKIKSDKILEDFGLYGPSRLELFATIHFIFKDLCKKHRGASLKNRVVDIVKEMKPKYSASQIRESYDKLRELGYI